MDRIGVPGPNATDEEKQQYAEMAQQVKQGHDNLRQLQINMGLLARTPNVADVTANNTRQQFTNPSGVYDEKAALASVDKMTAPSAVKQQIRQKLSAEPPNRPPAQLDAVLGALSKETKEQQIQYINTAPLSKADKQTLLQRINSGQSPNAEKNSLSEVGPDLTVIRTADGQLTSIINRGANDYVANNPGSKIVGQGTKGAESSTDDQKVQKETDINAGS